MAHGISRAQFLRGDFAARARPARPPWAWAEDRYTRSCSRCGDCIEACPEKILQVGAGGFPEVNFRRGECTFCGDCSSACETGALARRDEAGHGRAPWDARISVEPTCLGWQGVVCRVCHEQCEEGAIRIHLGVGGRAIPRMESRYCTGCGACVAPCPVHAITITVTASESGAMPATTRSND